MADERDIVKEIFVPTLEVPKEFPPSIAAGDLDDIKDPTTKKILLRMSSLQDAINFAIKSAVECRAIEAKVAIILMEVQQELIILRRTQRNVTAATGKLKSLLMIAIGVFISELVRRISSQIKFGP